MKNKRKIFVAIAIIYMVVMSIAIVKVAKSTMSDVNECINIRAQMIADVKSGIYKSGHYDCVERSDFMVELFPQGEIDREADLSTQS